MIMVWGIFPSRMNNSFSDAPEITVALRNLLAKIRSKESSENSWDPFSWIHFVNSFIAFQRKALFSPISPNRLSTMGHETPLPHLFRNSIYSLCLMRPVLIMMVWKHCRSMAHSFTLVRAGINIRIHMSNAMNYILFFFSSGKQNFFKNTWSVCTWKHSILKLKCENSHCQVACMSEYKLILHWKHC